MDETAPPALLVLKSEALAPENEVECEALIHAIAVSLGVGGETERATATDVDEAGTDQVIRFPVSQLELKSVEGGPAWTDRAESFFLVPDVA